MNSKTISILAYVTIIGWLVAFFAEKDQRDDLSRYHLKQGFGLFVVTTLFGVVLKIIGMIAPSLVMMLSLVGIIFFILMIVGIINAANEVKKPLPLIGNFFINQFSFI